MTGRATGRVVVVMMIEANNSKGLDRGALRLRLFLASPGDVTYERQLAREVVGQVGSERNFRGRLSIEVIAWDQPGMGVPMEAGLTPQEAIARGLPKPDACDLVVVILWSRIGTPLPADYTKADGSRYLSGTEWEYENALAGFRACSKPAVWVYQRTEEPKVGLDDPEHDAKLDQWRKVKAFLARMTNADGSIASGLNPYDTPDAFRRLLEQHLRDWLTRRIEALGPGPAVSVPAEAAAPAPPQWSDVPYPGLEVFRPEQAPIFFGRGREVDQLIAALRDPQVRFLAVVGVSGSGKSSLVRAGLVPPLRGGALGGVPWRDLAFRPGERGGDPFLALAYALKGALGTTGQSEAELAAMLRTDPKTLPGCVANLLRDAPPAAEFLLVVDQFEELFTQIEADRRAAFIARLGEAADLPRLRILATLRADFFAQAVAEPVLADLLRRDRGTVPLEAPDVRALEAMILGPARAAGLELEPGLADRILADTGTALGALPQMAFTLPALYETRKDDRRLTLAEYETIGGVQGAMARRAEATLRRLGGEPEQVLGRVFEDLVEVNEQEVATRRRAALAAVKRRADDDLLNALVDARLLVTGKGANDEPTVEVAHEALLTAWPRLTKWIETHAEALRARRDLERDAKAWDEAGRPGAALRTGSVLKRYRRALSPTPLAQAYLAACARRETLGRLALGATAALVLGVLGFFWWVERSGYPPALAAQGLLIRAGLMPVAEPAMVVVPVGEFQMGSPKDEEGRDTDEGPVHRVAFAQPFAVGRYEVTFAEYDRFAAATGQPLPRDQGRGRGNRPVINVSWEDATAYAEWLAAETGKGYRLLTEAEWEYAARAGTTTSRYWGDDPNEACAYANVLDDTFDAADTNEEGGLKAAGWWGKHECVDGIVYTAPVGTYDPNAFGLHDMLGNVWEWTCSEYGEVYSGAEEQCTSKNSARARVLRGGSWNLHPGHVRSASRFRWTADYRTNGVGFRLARSN